MQILDISKKRYAAASSQQKAEVEEKIKKLRKEGEKPVHGMFEFLDAQGGWLDFSFRFFKDEPIRTIKIQHGEICDLPMIVVKHLNNVYKKVRLPRENADKGIDIVTKTSRCRFTPMDVM